MKVLKFVGGAVGPPEIEYLEETIGFGDSYSYLMNMYQEVDETIGFNDSQFTITEMYLTESLGLGDSIAELISITETLGLGDALYEYGVANIFETLGLGDDLSHTMDVYVEIDETIGFSDSGYQYVDMDFNLRWRTRTKKLNYGYGTAPYGDVVSYGDGDVVDELKEFKVKVIRLSDNQLLRTDTIPIIDKRFPDGSARYTYTSVMNITDNTTFEPNLRFEIYQVDVNDAWSPAKYIDVTVTDREGDFT
jgi:hypothetical protein